MNIYHCSPEHLYELESQEITYFCESTFVKNLFGMTGVKFFIICGEYNRWIVAASAKLISYVISALLFSVFNVVV